MAAIPPFIPFLLLGGANGLFLGGMEMWLGGPGLDFSVGRLFGYPFIGIVALVGVSILSLAFPGFTSSGYLNLMNKMPSTAPGEKGKWVLGNGVSVLLGGIFNGLAFWVLHAIPFVQSMGFFGSALVGVACLSAYTSFVLPLLHLFV